MGIYFMHTVKETSLIVGSVLSHSNGGTYIIESFIKIKTTSGWVHGVVYRPCKKESENSYSYDLSSETYARPLELFDGDWLKLQ